MGFSLELAIEIIENGESTAKISLNITIQYKNRTEYEHYVGILKYSKKKSSLILYGVCIQQKPRPCSLLSLISYFVFQHILVTVVLIWYSECRYGANSHGAGRLQTQFRTIHTFFLHFLRDFRHLLLLGCRLLIVYNHFALSSESL